MDFLDIRKKAKERARARAAAQPAREPEAAGDGMPRPEPALAPQPPLPPADPGPSRAELAARLQSLPPATEAPAAAEAPFTTWRPGTGEPPQVVPPPEMVPELPAAGEGEFLVVGPALALAEARAAPEPAIAPARAREPAVPADPLDEFFYRPDEAAPALPQIAAVAALPDERPAPAADEEYLTFHVGGEDFALAIGGVREAIRAPPVTEVPRAPQHVVGVVTVRGEVIAVLDPRQRLGLADGSPPQGQRMIVIVDAGEGPCGLLVDRVTGVVRVPRGSVEPCPQAVAGARAEILAGIGRAGERLFTVLDAAALLRRAGARADAAPRGGRADAGA